MKHSTSDPEVPLQRPSKRARTSQVDKESTSASKKRPAKPSLDLSRFPDVSREYLQEHFEPGCRLFSKEELPGADVIYVPNFIDESVANKWYSELQELETCYQPTLKVYGKSLTQSRAIAAYTADPNLEVKYSGQTVQLHYPYPPILAEIQEEVVKKSGMRPDSYQRSEAFGFNHVMLNKYGDGSVYIGRHNDTNQNKVIASLSLGAERTFILTPKDGKKGKGVRWTLGNGSLLVMQGDTQLNWKHEIPKEPKVKEGRISITFRQVF